MPFQQNRPNSRRAFFKIFAGILLKSAAVAGLLMTGARSAAGGGSLTCDSAAQPTIRTVIITTWLSGWRAGAWPAGARTCG